MCIVLDLIDLVLPNLPCTTELSYHVIILSGVAVSIRGFISINQDHNICIVFIEKPWCCEGSTGNPVTRASELGSTS